MANIYTSVEELIGKTPLMALDNLAQALGLKARLLAKLERFNPGGSAKDRIAVAMIDQAERSGALQSGGMVIEATSGNTGVGLAVVAARRGYRAVIVMPDSMSAERQQLMKAFGAQLVLTPGALGMAGAVEKAEQLHAENPGSIIAGQFENKANALAHYQTTGPEIWEDCGGEVDIFVAGVGTGGTITGTGRYLKEQNGAIEIVAVEPASSPLLSGGKAGSHGLQGIGANFIPSVLDRQVYDLVMPVEDGAAFEAARLLAAKEGLLCGISSGAALSAAIALAQKEENAGKTVVCLLPDTGERYLSTGIFG
ncbi:MAG: cysteine synthase A [Oscillospiraceae bacterium]|nr:cysteine synthase A [Oscillospiraceae bacterium]